MEGGFTGDTEQNSTGFTRRENVSTFDPNWLMLRNSGVIRISVNAVLGHDADFSLTVAVIIIGTNNNLLSIAAVTSRHNVREVGRRAGPAGTENAASRTSRNWPAGPAGTLNSDNCCRHSADIKTNITSNRQ